MDALPEIIVATIGVIGLIVLVTSTKEIGGTVGKGFKFIKIGFAFFAAGFILMAVSELMGFKASIELIFEVLVLIGMILIAYGPRKIADTLKYISILER
ncbi:MAG: hypothetical protein K0A89_10615 [ANME-2 cluster archaeon]|nr:hypothetical protein [ANME-2 cluster archaeon]